MTIDVHVHPPVQQLTDSMGAARTEELFRRLGKLTPQSRDVESMVSDLNQCGIRKAVIFGLDAEGSGLPKFPNEVIAKIVDKYPGQFVGFACVDPHKGKKAVKELERAVNDLHLSGLKLHPIIQGFYPNDPKAYPLYAKCVELKIPVTIHTGWEYLGVGFPGGSNLRMKYGHPSLVDDVAADFPELRIIMAHPAWPWEDEQIAVVMQKDNVCMDLAGWMPRFYSPTLQTYLRVGAFNRKCLFGSDYPFLSVVQLMEEFRKLDLADAIKNVILEENAKRFLRLD